ncbi:MAG: serine/threonine-protein kinase, partial [Chloroflexi bacterium]|nr:serine/threonine-protein kinase [Chloroflexota bacterium]
MGEPQRIDHLELREQITQSEDVAVWHAIDSLAGVHVAIKVLLPGQSKDRFLREASLWRSVDHPNLANIYAVGEYQGLPWVAMEYSDRTLASLLTDSTPLDQELVSSIALAAARGLQAANQAGFLIADVAPANVLLPDDGTPKVIAYASAHLTNDSDITDRIPSPKLPSYTSPEQTEARQFDQRSAIYTFGALLFQMLTGIPPFSGSPEEIAAQHRRRPATSVHQIRKDVWPEMGRIADRCLERDPDSRFQTFFELVINLALASGSVPPEQHRSVRQRLSGMKLRLAAALAVVAAGIVAVFL